jgi:hypothetical protein
MDQRNMGRIVITSLICAIFALLSLQACTTKREGATGANGNRPESTNQGGAQSMSQAGGIVPSDETRTFRGEIGDQNRIEMRLVRAGERLSGTYAYEKVGTNINLSGTIDAKGNFTLQESDANGKQTGVFKGEWKEPESEAGATLDGSWTKADGSGELTFYLIEQHINFSGGLKMVARQIKEENKKKKYAMAAEYPQIEGSTAPGVEAFNREVSGFVTAEINEWKSTAGRDPDETDDSIGGDDDLTIRYDVMLANDDLASIIFFGSVYEHGAAHPNSYSKVINYDLKNNHALKLADLFQPNSNYLATISAYSIDDLKRQSKKAGPDESMLDDENIEEGASAQEDNYRSWNITPKGLLVTFDAYQVGPYAAGPQSVVIPYAALKGIIRADGPLAPFVK